MIQNNYPQKQTSVFVSPERNKDSDLEIIEVVSSPSIDVKSRLKVSELLKYDDS